MAKHDKRKWVPQGYLHEAVDRAHTMNTMFDALFDGHPAIVANEEVEVAAEFVSDVLMGFYQLLGAGHPGDKSALKRDPDQLSFKEKIRWLERLSMAKVRQARKQRAVIGRRQVKTAFELIERMKDNGQSKRASANPLAHRRTNRSRSAERK